MISDWQAGYAEAKAQAEALARLYETELHRLAMDTWYLDPARELDFSDAAVERTNELIREGGRKAEAAHAAKHIADAIATMESGTSIEPFSRPADK